MDVSEKWGNDVDTAVELALAELKCSRDEVEVTVLEQPSRGFFGIGAKLALVRVEKKAPVVETEPAPVVVEEKAPVAAPQKQKPQKSERKAEKKRENGICTATLNVALPFFLKFPVYYGILKKNTLKALKKTKTQTKR